MQEQEKQTAKGRDLYEWVQSLVGSVLVVVAIFTFVIRHDGRGRPLHAQYVAARGSSAGG
ncbi:MAG: hypothetical protein ACLSHO_09480 [Dysosmobacter sp.]